jgi:hypothetical protein
MRTKNSIPLIVVVSLLILITLASTGFYFSWPQAVVLAGSESVAQPLLAQPTDVVAPQAHHQDTLSVTQDEITVNVTSAKIIDTGVEIGICYTTPDNGEWRPQPGHLFYDKGDASPNEIEFLENEKLADGKNNGMRCALVRYHVDDLNTLTTPLEFSILRFYAPGREMYSACQEFQQRLNTNPKAQAHGLKAKCEDNADGTSSVKLLDHAKSITDDKAQKDLDAIASAEVLGDWKFTITDLK